jgi:hypothetical protein
MKAKEKDSVIETLQQEIKDLKKDKAKLEEKVRKLLEFIGGSDPTTNASKRRSFTHSNSRSTSRSLPRERRITRRRPTPRKMTLATTARRMVPRRD